MNKENLVNEICSLFGVSPVEVKINDFGESNDGKGNYEAQAEIEVNPKNNDVTDNVKIFVNTGKEVLNNLKNSEKFKDVVNSLKNLDLNSTSSFEKELEKTLGSGKTDFRNLFGNFLDEILSIDDKKEEPKEIDSKKEEEKSKEISQDLQNCSRAELIKSNLRNKMNEQIKKSKIEKFIKKLPLGFESVLYDFFDREKYSSLTNDVDSENAGVYIILDEDDIKSSFNQIEGFDSDEIVVSFEDILKSVNIAAKEIAENYGFKNSAGAVESNDGKIIVSFWF